MTDSIKTSKPFAFKLGEQWPWRNVAIVRASWDTE